MKRNSRVYSLLMLCGAVVTSTIGLAGQAPPSGPPLQSGQAAVAATQRPVVSCSRGGIQTAINLYLEAQSKGDISGLPLATGLGYQENMKAADVKTGFLVKPLKIDRALNLIDQDSCQSFTEIIVTNKAEPYVAGVRMRVNRDKIAEIEVVWTTTGYWLFNADAYLQHGSIENWGPIPPENRDTRGTLVKAANAYLDAFLEAKIDLVPWGFPCVRIEGGMYTGKGRNDDSCEAGVPPGVNIANRRFVVDEVIGSVVVYCTFGAGGPNGGSGAPDTHLFRLENGKLRYVHTLTHLLQASFRNTAPPPGNPPPAAAPTR
ncbi:MAG: hypothetical protein ABI859_04910 [Pseudomonadota bacterium]